MTPVGVDELARVERGLAARAAEVRAGRVALRRACRAAGVDEPRSLWVASAAGGRFRPAVAVREYLPERQREVVVDLSQAGPAHELEAVVRPLLTGAITGEGCGDLPVGGFAPYRRSPIWGLNRAFWEHADRYMAASGGDYRDAVGGSPDLIRPLVRERAERFCASLRRVRDGRQSGERPELAYLSIGASGAEGPCLFAQELTRAAAAEPVGLEGVCYLVADLSPHVLTAVRAALGDRHGPLRVGYLQLDLRTPEPTLSTWQGRILHAHVGNLFDNLPADHVEWRAGRCYLVEGLLYLPASAAHGLAARYGIGLGLLRKALEGPVTSLPERLLASAGAPRMYRLWADLYHALRIGERLVPPPPETPPEGLLPYADDGRMALSDDAIDSGLALLGLLHEQGVLQIVDIMIADARQYAGRFRTTAKYDGSAVEWFNAALFEARVRRELPGCAVGYRSLAGFGKPRMTAMEIRRSGRERRPAGDGPDAPESAVTSSRRRHSLGSSRTEGDTSRRSR